MVGMARKKNTNLAMRQQKASLAIGRQKAGARAPDLEATKETHHRAIFSLADVRISKNNNPTIMKLSTWLPLLLSAQSLISVASFFQPTTTTRLNRMPSNRVGNPRSDRGYLDTMDTVRLRGGGDAKMSSTSGQAASKKRVRIPSFDSMRFLFITCIVCGHFIRFASPSDFVFKFFSQHNVIVGAFFALSGYVTAYTSTEVGEPKASPKLTDTPSQQWILSRVFGYYPLHLATLLLFSPMFVYVDMYYNGLMTTLRNSFLSITMTQSWFPNLAEIGNAPTASMNDWNVLSSLSHMYLLTFVP